MLSWVMFTHEGNQEYETQVRWIHMAQIPFIPEVAWYPTGSSLWCWNPKINLQVSRHDPTRWEVLSSFSGYRNIFTHFVSNLPWVYPKTFLPWEDQIVPFQCCIWVFGHECAAASNSWPHGAQQAQTASTPASRPWEPCTPLTEQRKPTLALPHRL